MVLMAMSVALNSTWSMYWCPSSLSYIWVLLLGLYIPDHAMLPSRIPSEFLVVGMKEPHVYMHCCG